MMRRHLIVIGAMTILVLAGSGCVSKTVRIMYDGSVEELDAYFAEEGLSVNGVDQGDVSSDDRTYLMRAVAIGRLDIAKHLVAKGADVNATMPVYHYQLKRSSSVSALSIAAKKCDYNMIHFLLSKGANLSLAITQLRQDPDGSNAIEFLESVGPVGSRSIVEDPLFKRPKH